MERCINRLKQWRAITTRYDKRALNYRAGIIIASLILWLAAVPPSRAGGWHRGTACCPRATVPIVAASNSVMIATVVLLFCDRLPLNL